jgi:hypothetical protein
VPQPLASNVLTGSFTPNTYAYSLSFAGQQYNYSATVAIVMGVITAVIAYVVQLRGSRSPGCRSTRPRRSRTCSRRSACPSARRSPWGQHRRNAVV